MRASKKSAHSSHLPVRLLLPAAVACDPQLARELTGGQLDDHWLLREVARDRDAVEVDGHGTVLLPRDGAVAAVNEATPRLGSLLRG
jgi:hypothetical protein